MALWNLFYNSLGTGGWPSDVREKPLMGLLALRSTIVRWMCTQYWRLQFHSQHLACDRSSRCLQGRIHCFELLENKDVLFSCHSYWCSIYSSSEKYFCLLDLNFFATSR